MIKPPSKSRGRKPRLTPKLRFPQFRNEPKWHERKLGEFASITTERVGDKICTPMSITSGVGLISQREKFGRTIAGTQYKNYLLLQKNDFAYNKSATKEFPQGYIALYSGDELVAVPNSIFTCFRISGDSPNPEYLNYLFLGNLHGKWLRKYLTVGARAHGSLNIDAADLLLLPVPLPSGKSSLTEQRKIAKCLVKLDELIEAEKQKLDALRGHKNGLMQQLFPREGKTVPLLRFPEFQNATEWDCGDLSNYLEAVIDYRGKAPPKSDSGVPLITAKNVRFGWLDMSNDEYIEASQYDGWMSKGIPKAGDILFTTEAPLGNVAPFPSTGRFALGQRIIALRTRKERCLPGFLFQSLLSPVMQKAIEFHSTGSTAKGIKSSVFVGIRFCIPRIREQQRIVACLSSLDDMVAAQGDKLEALRTHKKGLMQQLFPSTTATDT